MTPEEQLRTQDHALGAMISISALHGVFDLQSRSGASLPPKDKAITVNTNNYRKAFNTNPVLEWGETNQFPQLLDAEAMKSSVFESGMKVYCDHLYGGGFFIYEEVIENGQRIVKEVNDPELMAMLYDAGYHEYYEDACVELPHWGNIWPIYQLNANRKIAHIQLEDGPYCRLERPHPTTGKIENLYLSAQWPNGLKLTSPEIPADKKGWIKKLPLIDRFNYVFEMETMKATTFAQHLKFKSSGQSYGRAPWHALYLNHWLNISAGAPKMMARLYEASLTINYLVYMHDEWIRKKFPDWEKAGFDKEGAIKALQDSWDSNLSGSDNAFKTLMLSMRTGDDGKLMKSVEFVELNNRLKQGDFIPDSQIADAQILFAIGIDPTLIGLVQPGGKQSAGSGSNIREASLALNMRMRSTRELLHTPFYVLRDVNFKGDAKRANYKIGTRDYIINTLDQRAAASTQEVTAQ